MQGVWLPNIEHSFLCVDTVVLFAGYRHQARGLANITMADITTEQVWEAIGKQLFAVMGMVTAKNEARTAGIVYIVRHEKLYVASVRDAWKVRHVQHNPHVSMTVMIPKSIPLMPWIKIPAATITFSGVARVLEVSEAPVDVKKMLFRGLENVPDDDASTAIIEVTPQGDFVTYGVGVSLMGMRDTQNARGRVQV